MKQPQPVQLWGALWRSRNRLDGEQTHLLGNYDNGPALFRTRAKAREWIEKHYGYIAKRPDLRAEPHGWLIPIPVRVVVSAVSNDQAVQPRERQ